MARHKFLVSMVILIAAAAGVGAQEARGPEVEAASVVYDYYNPEAHAVVAPLGFAVR